MTDRDEATTATVGRLWAVTLDCAETAPLAGFWAAVLGGTVHPYTDDFTGVELPSGLWIGVYRVDDHRPPQWPDGDVPKQFHLDVAVPELDSAEREVVGLGARKAAHQPAPDRWRVFLDPAGHPFCITNQMG